MIRALAFLALMAAPAAAEITLNHDLDCPTEHARIVVVGDSLADGLWASLHRSFARCGTMEVVRLTAVSDGLAKTSATDWLDRYAETTSGVETQATDIVVVQVGANDLTAIRSGTRRAVFGSENWDDAYAARAAELADGLGGEAAAVLWFGLPIVGKDALDESYRNLSRLQRQEVEARGIPFYDIHEMTKFGAEDFVMNAEVDGRLQQLRATDKVHFTSLGYDIVAAAMHSELKTLLARRDRSAALSDGLLQ